MREIPGGAICRGNRGVSDFAKGAKNKESLRGGESLLRRTLRAHLSATVATGGERLLRNQSVYRPSRDRRGREIGHLSGTSGRTGTDGVRQRTPRRDCATRSFGHARACRRRKKSRAPGIGLRTNIGLKRTRRQDRRESAGKDGGKLAGGREEDEKDEEDSCIMHAESGVYR